MAKLTPDQVREIADRRERGWSYGRLAQRYGVSTGAIHYQCLKQGAVSPRSRAPTRRGPGVFQANDGRTQKRFTEEEDARILALENDGLSADAIARALNRPRTSIRIRLMTLALRSEGYANG